MVIILIKRLSFWVGYFEGLQPAHTYRDDLELPFAHELLDQAIEFVVVDTELSSERLLILGDDVTAVTLRPEELMDVIGSDEPGNLEVSHTPYVSSK